MAVHAANKPDFKHAERIGKTRPYMMVVWSGLLLCFLAQAIPTQIIAARLSYISWLGKGLLPGVYFPGEYLIWMFRWWQPWAIPFHRPIMLYPLAFKLAFMTLIWSEPLAFVVAILLTVSVARATIPKDDLDPLDAGARWFDYEQAKKQGLDQDGGMIVGIDPRTGKVLRYCGNQGAQYIDPPGNGKALDVETQILTPVGYRRLGDIRVGDLVIGRDGRPTRVVGVFPQGRKDAYRVTFSDGAQTVCCDEHLWAVTTKDIRAKRRGGPRKPWVLSLAEIRHLLTPGVREPGFRLAIPMVEPVQFEKRNLPLDPYTMGVLIGDGGLSQKSLRLSSMDEEIVASVAHAVEPLGVKVKSVRGTRCDYHLSALVERACDVCGETYAPKNMKDRFCALCRPQGRVISRREAADREKVLRRAGRAAGPRGGTARPNAVRAVIERYGLEKRAEEKHIPDDYKFAHVEARLALLQGLLDTDGSNHRSGGIAEFTTTSRQLAEDVVFLVQSLGGTAKINERVTRYRHAGVERFGRVSFRLHLKVPAGIEPFRLARKRRAFFDRKKYPILRMFKVIEACGHREMVCIKVGATDELFVIEGCVVTHNTTTITASLLSRMKLMMRRRVWWQFWVKVRQLTAMERREHPWGEEPLVLATDPKFEYLGWTSGFQHDVLGKRTECVAPLGIPEQGFPVVQDDGETVVYQPFPPELVNKLARYNPFWTARIGTKDSYQDCLTKARALIDTPNPQGENAFFSQMAEIFGAGVIEHCAYVALNTGNYKLFSVPGMLDYISSFKAETITEANGQKREKPGLEVMLDAMKRYPHDLTGRMGWTIQHSNGTVAPTKTKPSIFNAADKMASLADRTRASVFGAFVNKLAIFDGERIRDYVMDSTFEFDAMADDPKRSSTIYIGVDAMNLKEVKGYLRLLQEDAMRVLTRGGTPIVNGRSLRPHKYPWVVVADEAYAAGYNDVIDNSSGFIRGFGGFVWMVWQSYAQWMKTYSDSQSRNVISETLGVFLFGPSKTVEGGSYIEDELGKAVRQYTVESKSGEAFSMSPLGHVQEQIQTPQAPLISAKEFTQLPKTHVIAVIDGFNYYLKKAQFFLFPELVKRSKMKPKLSGENTVKEPFFVRCFRQVVGEDGWAQLLEEREKIKPEIVQVAMDDLTVGNDPITGGSGTFYKIDAGIAKTAEKAIQIALNDFLSQAA